MLGDPIKFTADGNQANILEFNYGIAELVGSITNSDLILSTNSQNKPGRATNYWLINRNRARR
jgi:hypothetical protein